MSVASVVVRWGVGVVVVAAVAAGGWWGYRHYHGQKASAAPTYFTVAAGMGPVDVSVAGSGQLAAVATQNVVAQVTGGVDKLDVAVGSPVKAGDPLLQVADTTGLAAQVTQAEDTLAQAKAQLAALNDPAASVDPRAVEQAQIRVQQAQASLDQAQLKLSTDQAAFAADTPAASTVDGTVTADDASDGRQVAAGAVLATIAPDTAPTITVPVPEHDLPFLPTGSAATVTIPAIQQTVNATVTARADTPSGTASAGQGANAATSELYALTLTVDPAVDISAAPAGASATVTLVPQNNPPAAYTWSATGSVTFAPTVTVTAAQAGVVAGLLPVGARVTSGQQVAAVNSTQETDTIKADQMSIAQDQLSLQSAQVSLDQTEHPAAATAAALASAVGSVAAAQETLTQRQAALANLTVTAPIGGTVTALPVQAGDNVGNGTAVATIQSTTLQAVVSIDELDIGKISVGDKAALAVGAFPANSYTGTVAAIAPTASSANGVASYDVTISLDPAKELRPGMSVSATITVQSVAQALRVPSQAVTVTAGNNGIIRMLENGSPVAVPVQIGLRSTEWTQITSGLQPGQSVIAGSVATSSTGSGGAGPKGGFAGPPAGAVTFARGGGGATFVGRG